MELRVDGVVELDVESEDEVLRGLHVGPCLRCLREGVARGLAAVVALADEEERARGLDVVVVLVLRVLLHLRDDEVLYLLQVL